MFKILKELIQYIFNEMASATGKSIRYKKHYQLEDGDYLQPHGQHNDESTSNTTKDNSSGPSAIQEFEVKKCIRIQVPITYDVMDLVNQSAQQSLNDE
jgi:hypothetical protein